MFDVSSVGALSVAIPQPRYSDDVERKVMDLLERTAALNESA